MIAISSALAVLLQLLVLRWFGAEAPGSAPLLAWLGLSAWLGLGLGAMRPQGDTPHQHSQATFRVLLLLTVLEGLEWFPWPGPIGFEVGLAAWLTAWAFAPLGWIQGRLWQPGRGSYQESLLGAAAGTVSAVGLCLTCAPPAVWAVAIMAILIWLFPMSARAVDGQQVSSPLAMRLVLLGVVAVGLPWSQYLVQTQDHVRILWSPYAQLRLLQGADGFLLDVNHEHNVVGKDLRGLPFWAQFFGFPRGKRVLVLGAGGGNDVAGALQNGASEVDAVEIDPVIAQITRQGRPDHPLDDPRVHTIIEDARAFVSESHPPYDVIVVRDLRSGACYSGLTGLTLADSLLTVEGLGRLRALLQPEGALLISLDNGRPEVRPRLEGMLRQAFAVEPRAFTVANYFVELVAPPALAGPPPLQSVPPVAADPRGATDDWPFLRLGGGLEDYATAAFMLGIILLAGVRPPKLACFGPAAASMLAQGAAMGQLGIWLGFTNLTTAVASLAALGAGLLGWWLSPRLPRNRWLGAVPLVFLAVPGFSFPPLVFLALTLVSGRLCQELEADPTGWPSALLGGALAGFLQLLPALTGFRCLFLIAAGLSVIGRPGRGVVEVELP